METLRPLGIDDSLDPPPMAPHEETEEPDLLAPLKGDDAPPFSCLRGTAGSGKTFAVRNWAHEDGGIALTATTGIAAINMGDAGTINSLLRYYDLASLREKYLGGWLHTLLRRLQRRGTTRIVIDELSMLDGQQLDLIVDAIQEVARQDGEPPLGLTLCGDFGQLGPVKAQYAFQAKHWPEFHAHTVVLNRVRRQADAAFIQTLQAIRQGDVSSSSLATLRPCYALTTDLGFAGTTLVARNEEVDRLNRQRYDPLPGQEIRWPTHRVGKQPGEWKQVPEWVALKEGALVMILANKPIYEEDHLEGYVYVNGDLATVLDPGTAEPVTSKQHVPAKLPLVELVRTREAVSVSYVQREVFDPEDDRKKRVPIGEINYLPLRLAYATTTHKAQGLSFDTVQVNIRDHFWTAPSLLYVALSRARTTAGLRIVGSEQMIRAKARVDPMVRPWL